MSPPYVLSSECGDLQKQLDLLLFERQELRSHLATFINLAEQVKTMHTNLETSMREIEAIQASIENLQRVRKAYLEQFQKEFYYRFGAGS